MGTPCFDNHPILDVKTGPPSRWFFSEGSAACALQTSEAQAEIEALRADKSLWGLDEDFLELLVESLDEMEIMVY